LFELSGAHASYADLCAVLVDWKQDKETDWLNEAPSQALQQSLSVKNLDAAWALRWDWLKKLKQGRIKRTQLMGEPVFKKKEKHASFRYPQGTCLEQNNNRIGLPKLGWVAIWQQAGSAGCGQERHGEPGRCRWMVSIQTGREVEAPVHRSATAVGIDVGVVRLATLSDGTY
jgi:putative transposase